MNLFQNEGYSEVRPFELQSNCAPPAYVQVTAERDRLNLEWNGLPEHSGFTVSYRLKESNGVSEWKEQPANEPRTTLYGPKSGATYEYRVAALCMAGQPVYTPVLSITLPQTDEARLARCGLLPAVNLSNQEPIQ